MMAAVGNTAQHTWLPIATESACREVDEDPTSPSLNALSAQYQRIFPKQILSSCKLPPPEDDDVQTIWRNDLSTIYKAFQEAVNRDIFGDISTQFRNLQAHFTSNDDLPLKDSHPHIATLFTELTAFSLLLSRVEGSIERFNPHLLEQICENPNFITYLDLSSLDRHMTDDKLSALIERFPGVRHLILDGCSHLTHKAFSTVLKCNSLVIFSASSCSALFRWDNVPDTTLDKLKVLVLSKITSPPQHVIDWASSQPALESVNLRLTDAKSLDLSKLEKSATVSI